MTKLHQKYFRGSSKSVFEQIQNSSKKGEWAVAVKFLGQKNDKITLGIDEIKALDLPKKQAAKLIAKITGENPKELYEKMVTER
jgi:16S rRNA (cytidine1402-2'-O)-methyltransferase